MKVAEFMLNDAVTLPKERKNDEFFQDFVVRILKEYIKLIEQLDNDCLGKQIKNEKQKIMKLCSIIERTIDCYFKGMSYEAYGLISKEITEYLDYKCDYYFKTRMDFNFENQPLFRIRKSHEEKLSKKEMFHIPFEKNEIVESYRYSIPGVPCLYLGGSISICLKELNLEEISDDIFVSRFKVKDSYLGQIKMLNLGMLPQKFAAHIVNNEDYNENIEAALLDYLVCWPLIAVCSFKVSNPYEYFKPEYIIPQMLLQWVKYEGKYDGIQYFTTKLNKNEYPEKYYSYQNFVFPPKKIIKKGLCSELMSYFDWSEPISWKEAKGQIDRAYLENQKDKKYLELLEEITEGRIL